MVGAGGDHGIDSEVQDLRESDREVLDLLRNEPASAVGFQGLKRRLGLHPEKLSRALRRLERDDLVEKTDLGYRLAGRARAFLSPTAIRPATPAIPVLQTFLPPEVHLPELAAYLRGKWFGDLRWYGLHGLVGNELDLLKHLVVAASHEALDRAGALSIEA